MSSDELLKLMFFCDVIYNKKQKVEHPSKHTPYIQTKQDYAYNSKSHNHTVLYDVLTPTYVITKYNSENIVIISNDTYEWEYSSNLFNVNKLITISNLVDINVYNDFSDIDLIYVDMVNISIELGLSLLKTIIKNIKKEEFEVLIKIHDQISNQYIDKVYSYMITISDYTGVIYIDRMYPIWTFRFKSNVPLLFE